MIEIYTDGSCIKNPGGKGAWSFVVVSDGNLVYQDSGTSESTTNNIMEIMAVFEAAKFVRSHAVKEDVKIYSDSQYVINGIKDWMPSWKKKGWKKKNGEIKNLFLWQDLDAFISGIKNLSFHWVRGHNGNKWNELADQLCTAATNVSQVVSGRHEPKPVKYENIPTSIIFTEYGAYDFEVDRIDADGDFSLSVYVDEGKVVTAISTDQAKKLITFLQNCIEATK